MAAAWAEAGCATGGRTANRARPPRIAVTASYIATCTRANVIGVRSGAMPLAVAAADAATLHWVMTSGAGAAAGRAGDPENASHASAIDRLFTGMRLMGPPRSVSCATISPPPDEPLAQRMD